MEKFTIADGKPEKGLLSIKTICGPMFAGKSAKIIGIAETFKNNKINFICLKPKSDHRLINGVSTKNKIVSRGTKLVIEAKELDIDFSDEETEELLKKHNAFIFDETQFFKLESIKNFILIARKIKIKTQIVFAGLDMDFIGREFETIKYVKEISDEIVMLRANCSVKGCGNKASYSSKIAGDKTKQIEIGGDEMYKPTCSEHHRQILDCVNIKLDKI